jgi:hypothetical protein
MHGKLIGAIHALGKWRNLLLGEHPNGRPERLELLRESEIEFL